MEETNDIKQFKLSEVITLLVITLIIGTILGISIFKVIYEGNEKNNTQKDEQLTKFIDNYNYIVDNYYGELDKKELIDSAISGMVDSIGDPYTTYIDEDNSNKFTTTLEGTFEGIGVEIVNDSDNNIVIYNVLTDSPAEKAGLEPLDIIKEIDGENLEGMTTTDFVSKVKNSANPTITLSILRENETIEKKVTRQQVTIKSVKSEIFEQSNKKIGYIYISIFANNTYSQFKKELENLEQKNIDSLIIDVRGNTGGHLTAVENILGLFLDSSHIIYKTEDKKNTQEVYSKGTKTKQYKIVVLTDESSASASEILAAALKEEYGATLVGKKTYGKGTVQELKTLSDGAQYKFTTKKWLTPKGNWINEVGIEVDIDVEFDKSYYEDPKYENDNQLQEAIKEIIK